VAVSPGAVAVPQPSAPPRPRDLRAGADAQLPVSALLVAWIAVSWAIAWTGGTYAVPALTLVLIGAGALGAAAVGVRRRAAWANGPLGQRAALLGVASLLVATPLVHLQRLHPHVGGPAWLAATVLGGLATAGLGVVLARAALVERSAPLPVLAGIGCLALAADALTVVAAPDPFIDVWVLLQATADGLASGANLYTQTWSGAPGLTDTYPYLPATTVLLAPGRWLLGDVRYALVGWLAVAAMALGSLAGSARARRGGFLAAGPLAAALPALPLLVLAYPRSVYVIQQSWTEPLLLALLAGFVLAVLRGAPRTAVVCLALALASKQHVVLLLPVAAWWPAFGWRRSLAAAGLGVAVVTPWLLADPGALWEDAVRTNLAYRVLPTALDLPALLLRVGVTAGFGLTVAALAASYAVVVRLLPRDAAGFAAGAALVLLATALTNKQSFFNHYTLVTGLLVLAAVLAVRREPAPG